LGVFIDHAVGFGEKCISNMTKDHGCVGLMGTFGCEHGTLLGGYPGVMKLKLSS
jgi:hypothetical protein